MSDTLARKPHKIAKSGVWWLVGCGIIFALRFPLGLINDATQLTPDHSSFIGLSFAFGGLAAVIAIFVLWRATPSWPVANRIGFALACAFLGFLSLSLLLMPAVNIVEGWIDFPPSKTVIYKDTLVKISRAYQTRGKGRSWNIQTMPIWSNINITQDDYDEMLSHRSLNDHGKNPDEIMSKGYFCAQVTVQRAGDAIRIMHAGNGKLPRGSIVVCPPNFELRAHI